MNEQELNTFLNDRTPYAGYWYLNGNYGDCKETLVLRLRFKYGFHDDTKSPVLFCFENWLGVFETFQDNLNKTLSLLHDGPHCLFHQYSNRILVFVPTDSFWKSEPHLIDLFTVLTRFVYKTGRGYYSIENLSKALRGSYYETTLLQKIIKNFDAFIELTKEKEVEDMIRSFNGLVRVNSQLSFESYQIIGKDGIKSLDHTPVSPLLKNFRDA